MLIVPCSMSTVPLQLELIVVARGDKNDRKIVKKYKLTLVR